MLRLTTAQSDKVVIHVVATTFRALRRDYGTNKRPTTPAIGKILMKFEEAGSSTDIVKAAHHCLDRSNLDFAATSQSAAEDCLLFTVVFSSLSSQGLELSYGTL